MKKAILFLTLCVAMAVAQTSTDKTPAQKAAPKKTSKTTTAPAPPTAQPLVIPKDAVVQPEGTYKYTDKNGKRWIYSNTFFGVSRMEDMSDPNAPPPVKQAPAFDRFTDEGEIIRFERQTPFGPLKWERRKAELTDEERTAIANFKPAEKK